MGFFVCGMMGRFGYENIMKKYLLPILLIAFWSCEDKEEIKEMAQHGNG